MDDLDSMFVAVLERFLLIRITISFSILFATCKDIDSQCFQ